MPGTDGASGAMTIRCNYGILPKLFSPPSPGGGVHHDPLVLHAAARDAAPRICAEPVNESPPSAPTAGPRPLLGVFAMNGSPRSCSAWWAMSSRWSEEDWQAAKCVASCTPYGSCGTEPSPMAPSCGRSDRLPGATVSRSEGFAIVISTTSDDRTKVSRTSSRRRKPQQGRKAIRGAFAMTGNGRRSARGWGVLAG